MTTNEPPSRVHAPPNGERIAARVTAHDGDTLALTFDEIEEIIGESLSMAWRTRASLWSSEGTKRSIVRLLRDAGWRARLDYVNRRVVFRREGA
jgi:hypothetical protein